MKSDNLLATESYHFALRIVKLSKYLQKEHKEYVLSRQILRSGTAIGAMVKESEFAQSKADFANKLSQALKEANETDYWLALLHDAEFINEKMYQSIEPEIKTLIKLLVSSVKTVKSNME
jgi:four helix bundle protein